MFGLENQKKKKSTDEYIFDLEKDLKIGKKHRELKKKIEDRIQKIKEFLRSGENKSEFDKCGTLLHGYTSLLKVMARFNAKE
jgi:molecular chaperone DnaK (HSP70)